ncbi:MAG: hypothetical protein IJR45_06110 [Firmicutes bacterium]|nr:hypothetical protein [Bacillota bacterium]
MKTNKLVKIAVLNLIIIVAAVVTYSPGLLAWYPNDPSIFKAGMSILIGIFLAVIFLYGNSRLLSDPKLPVNVDVNDFSQATKILDMYKNGSYFGKTAQTVLDQIERLGRSMSRLQSEIDRKFDKNSMSNDKYSAIVNEANLCLTDNLISAAQRMQFFDEGEYKRLLNFEKDSIPDDIQQQQLNLYKMNEDSIKNVVTANEKLILQLDTLAVELGSKGESNDELLDEIKKLTQEVKYYK